MNRSKVTLHVDGLPICTVDAEARVTPYNQVGMTMAQLELDVSDTLTRRYYLVDFLLIFLFRGKMFKQPEATTSMISGLAGNGVASSGMTGQVLGISVVM